MTTRTVVQFKDRDPLQRDDETQARIMARDMLQARFEANGEVMVGDATPGPEQPVVLNPDRTDWSPASPGGYYDGWIIEWTATGEPAVPSAPPPLGGGAVIDGAYVVDLRPDTVGGVVRVVHDLDREVTVAAYSGEEPVGYLFASEVTPNEVEVELADAVATTRLVITPDATDA